MIIFRGPSISESQTRTLAPTADVRGPVARGDLRELQESRECGPVLIIDGLFGPNFAAPVSEYVDLLRTGVVVVGCSSMGAIRALECGVAGMVGLGRVHELLLSGRVVSDADLGVAVDATNGFAALSISTVDVIIACDELRHSHEISEPEAHRIVEASRGMDFLFRSWPGLLEAAFGAPQPRLCELFSRQTSAKLLDARAAIQICSRMGESVPTRPGASPDRSRRGFPPMHLGHLTDEVRGARFGDWLIGSGRVVTTRAMEGVALDELLSWRWQELCERLDEARELDGELHVWLGFATLAGELAPSAESRPGLMSDIRDAYVRAFGSETVEAGWSDLRERVEWAAELARRATSAAHTSGEAGF